MGSYRMKLLSSTTAYQEKCSGQSAVGEHDCGDELLLRDFEHFLPFLAHFVDCRQFNL